MSGIKAKNKDSFQRGTYHNHTTWSDGTHTPDALVEKAMALGFQEVGITDHYMTLKGGINCVSDDKISDYLKMIDSLKDAFSGSIRVLGGLEIDTSAYNTNRSSLPVRRLNKLDYVLFEYVDDKEDWLMQSPDNVAELLTEKYAEHQIANGQKPEEQELKDFYESWARRSPVQSLNQIITNKKGLTCATGLAHPNMLNLISIYGADNLAKTLAESDIFIDACGSARNSRRQPYDNHDKQRRFTLNIEGMGEEFKAAAIKYGVKFIPSSDTHKDNNIDKMADTQNALDTLKRYQFARQEF